MTKPPPFRRRVYLINPRFQWRFIGFMTIVSLAAILLLFISNILFFQKMKQEALEAGLTLDNPFFDFIAEQQELLGQIYFGTSLVTFIIIMSIGIFYSHRIAGPLYQLNKRMKSIAEGEEVGPVRFRKRDLFLELQDSFNSMIDRVSKKDRD